MRIFWLGRVRGGEWADVGFIGVLLSNAILGAQNRY
jgi:hypothetical protein